jgi:hypothetical protein
LHASVSLEGIGVCDRLEHGLVIGDAVHGHGFAQGAGVRAAAAEPATASEANTAAAQAKGRCLNIKWTPESKKKRSHDPP